MNNLEATYRKETFQFKRPGGTSRGVLTEKHAWILEVWDSGKPSVRGMGECSIIPGLSPDFSDFKSYEAKLDEVCKNLSIDLSDWPSLKFGVESALLDLKNGGKRIYFNNAFASGEQSLPINGLIWMGDKTYMQEQIDEKLADGFTTLKMKVGAIDFETEYKLLKSIRERFDSGKITLRVDANGAFSLEEALDKLQQLAELEIHSIEQPIKAGQWELMAQLCRSTPLPIALDEELIGVHSLETKVNLLDTIQPQFIILKPSLHGGISGTQEWISLAEERGIQWWMTSALESNVGLNVICQLTAEYDNPLPQGLGTGSLYLNNVPSNLQVESGFIRLNV